MLDIRRIRSNPEEVKEALAKRQGEFPIDEILEIDKKKRELLVKVENMKAEQNKVSKEIAKLKKEGEDAAEVIKEMRLLSDEIKELDEEVKAIDNEIRDHLLNIPNTPNAEVVEGESDADNVEVRKWGQPREFDFDVEAHWDLGTDLDILDFERAGKITGSRFTIFKGAGALLERALINFMLTTHVVEHNYTEILAPVIANRESMTGTGQLPKFEHDMFHLPGKDYFLIPTAEVTLTNLHRDEILKEEELPKRFTGYSPCFRQEAGAAGRDNRGLIRNHQFDKVELVKLVKPEDSYDELEKLTADAEEILQKLEIPYRVVMLSTGDLGFASAKTYDIEVWMPSYNDYVEISSCSNFEDFQARRSNLRFRDEETKKVEYLHTLNGSGLAVGRTFAALVENYQNEDGTITIPEVLRPYMAGLEKIEK